VTQYGQALEHAHDTLKSDKDVIFAAVKQLGGVVNDRMSVKDLVLEGVKQNPNVLTYISDETLKADKDLVLAAAIRCGCAVNDGTSIKDLALALVSLHGFFCRESAPI